MSIYIAVRLPARVQSVENAIEAIGGADTIAKVSNSSWQLVQCVNQIDAKLKQKTKLGQLEIREVKNKLKFSLSKDVQMPLETKKSH